MKIAINGFGRIGRLIFREWLKNYHSDLEIVAINDLACSKVATHLLKHDSVHGCFSADIKISNNHIIVDNHFIQYSSEANPANLNWKDVDIVLECTGKFKTREKCQPYFDMGIKKIIISAPGENIDKTIVFGVNDNAISSDDTIISNASCTTNCLAPLIKVLKDTIGIESGDMLTVHSYTGDQRLVDMGHSDLRRTRSAACNIIPTSTGAAKAISLIFPEFENKLHGLAMRVPVPDVSLVNFTFIAKRETTKEEINNLFLKASEGDLKGILGYSNEPLVSSDFSSSTYSSIIDSELTNVQNGTLCTVVAWYDNEYGFSCRMLDLAKKFGNV